MRRDYIISLISTITLILIFLVNFSDSYPFFESKASTIDSQKFFTTFQYYYVNHNAESQISKLEFKDFGYTNNYNGFLKVEIEPKTVLEGIISYIIALNLNHNSADTIKRTLLAYSNNALLLLNDDYVDNDKLVCKNFIPKFLSSVDLYEKIGIFKSLHADKLRQDISILASSLCE